MYIAIGWVLSKCGVEPPLPPIGHSLFLTMSFLFFLSLGARGLGNPFFVFYPRKSQDIDSATLLTMGITYGF